jgi:hypothetical protein
MTTHNLYKAEISSSYTVTVSIFTLLSSFYALAAQTFCAKQLSLWLWRYLSHLHILVGETSDNATTERLKNKLKETI